MMARYFFQAQYHGAMLTDDIGEEFPTLNEAETHATVVASELGRNSTQDQAVTVFCTRRGWRIAGAQRRDQRISASSPVTGAGQFANRFAHMSPRSGSASARKKYCVAAARNFAASLSSRMCCAIRRQSSACERKYGASCMTPLQIVVLVAFRPR
jgi:hypothetical protein